MDNALKKDKHFINKFLPVETRKRCRVGICDPAYLQRQKRIYSVKNKKWSAPPQELYPETKSIIVLIHFSPVSDDYKVEEIILDLALKLWEKARLKTHVINKSNKAAESLLLGVEWGVAATTYDKLVLLKDLAYYAGLGQFGRNTLLINRDFGSDFKIQVLLTKEKLEFDSPMSPSHFPGCNNCNQCLETCPTGTISDFDIDPLKCQWNWSNTDIRKYIKIESLRLLGFKKPKIDQDKYKIGCRNCQEFCKVNLSHYFTCPKSKYTVKHFPVFIPKQKLFLNKEIPI